MSFLVVIGLFLVGSAMGSFAGAQVWRLRAKQLDLDKRTKQPFDKVEYNRLKPLLKKRLQEDRSHCLSCGHSLAWFDLIPVASWLSLGGKCRYCRQPIGYTEFILEVVVGGMFVASVLFWQGSLNDPLELIQLALWLVAIVALAINFVYDQKWFLLVSGLNWLLIACGLIFAGIAVYQSSDPLATSLSALLAVGVLGGIYAILWAISSKRWVGEGDIFLGTGLALFLGNWPSAFVALFLANLIGTIVILPQLITGKLNRGSRVPFGPLLIAGAALAWFFGSHIVDWYQSLVF